MYIHDIFYDTSHLTVDDKKNLLLDAKSKSFRWWIDKHDDRSVRRRIKHGRFNTVLKRLDKESHFVFIHRGGYANEHNSSTMQKLLGRFIIETGFCTMAEESGDYFLFIDMDLKHLYFFIEKYRLYVLL